jgi:hypothetical protein
MNMHTVQIERRIVSRLVKDALKLGYTISLNDAHDGSGEWVVRKSRSYQTVMNAIQSTDGDWLSFRNEAGERVGVVSLVYGNGADVISDCSANDAMSALLIGAETVAANIQ